MSEQFEQTNVDETTLQLRGELESNVFGTVARNRRCDPNPCNPKTSFSMA